MRIDFSPEEAVFREEVRAFLDTHLTEKLRRASRLTSGVYAEADVARRWQAILHQRGWDAYTWPAEAGGPGWTPIQRYIFEKECAEAEAPSMPNMGMKLLASVLYTFGSEDQKARYLPAMRDGTDFWAQGFSEPGSGSDLASLKTRAVRDGDRYIVSGTKIWTTQAQYANRLFCLVRTDPAVKPQAGISFLLVDMDQPGVTVHPILSASGDHEVNQVFLDDATAPVTDLIGGEGDGWTIAKFLLENERGGACFAPALLADIRRLQADRAAELRACPAFALRLAKARLGAEALEITELRGLSERMAGASPGPQSLTTKLIASELRQEVELLRYELMGLDGLQLPLERPFYAETVPPARGSGAAQVTAARYLNSRAWSIFGGTTEVQLTIIASRALGL